MAKKKQPSIQDGLKEFKDVMLRASLSNYSYVDRVLLSKNSKGNSILIAPKIELWNAIMDDEELSKTITPIDITNPADYQLQPLFSFGQELSHDAWLDIDPEILFAGKVFKITIDGFDYQIPINKDCLPVKLRKKEYTDIKFRVFTSPSHVLGIKKYFPFEVENGGFSMIRLFQII